MGLGSAGLWTELLEESPPGWPGLWEAGGPPREDWKNLAARGGYPTPAHQLASKDQRAEWFAGYSATYLERDLLQLSAIENLADMRRLMAALCLRLGGLMNQAEISRDLGIPSSTVQRFLNLLEVSFQPSDRVCIKMIGRFIEQQDVGFFQEQTAKCNPSPFTARQYIHRSRARRAAQSLHCHLQSRVEIPGIGRIELLLNFSLLFQKTSHFIVGHWLG
jgi:hypothetical protein